jgi:hypothetical protein
MTDDHDVTTTLADDHVSATGFVPASADTIFDFLRHPSNHAALSGDGSVRGVTAGDEALQLGSKFGMKMKVGIPYRVSSKVVEFEQDRTIAWCHFGGHRWRWELEPIEGGTRVTETFDMSTAKFPPALRVAGYPKRHEDNVADSVRNLIAHFST